MAGLLFACGNNNTGGGGTGEDMAMSGVSVPDPGAGNNVDNDFKSTEPNDTPAQATPLGTSAAGDIHVWVSNNALVSGSNSDYFVFKTSAMTGHFSFAICGSTGVTNMAATLWKVVNGQEQTPPVGTWSAAGTCVMSTGSDAPLEASTDYLFGVQVTATATGSYSA
jgi:hypothetical protein